MVGKKKLVFNKELMEEEEITYLAGARVCTFNKILIEKIETKQSIL